MGTRYWELTLSCRLSVLEALINFRLNKDAMIGEALRELDEDDIRVYVLWQVAWLPPTVALSPVCVWLWLCLWLCLYLCSAPVGEDSQGRYVYYFPMFYNDPRLYVEERDKHGRPLRLRVLCDTVDGLEAHHARLGKSRRKADRDLHHALSDVIAHYREQREKLQRDKEKRKRLAAMAVMPRRSSGRLKVKRIEEEKAAAEDDKFPWASSCVPPALCVAVCGCVLCTVHCVVLCGWCLLT